MIPKIGMRYERHVFNGTFWEHEARHVLDVTSTGVLFEVVKPESTGTIIAEFDYRDPPQQKTRKEWNEWAILAREVHPNRR
jgi:hypothetical protein